MYGDFSNNISTRTWCAAIGELWYLKLHENF